jgi:hypothetical protein
MRHKRSATSWMRANHTNGLLHSSQGAKTCRGSVSISLVFYLGIGMLLLLLFGMAFVTPSTKPLIDHHANPRPATRLPAQVLISPGSNLYHVGSCRYEHRDSKPLETSEALHQGLVPCPFCIGNSAARLTPR